MAPVRWDVSRFYDVFTRRSESERFEALQALNDRALSADDLQMLIGKLIDALRREFPATREAAEQDESIGWTRTWMVTVLAQFAQVDSEAGQIVREVILAPYEDEPNEWVRYWALVGVVRQKDQSAATTRLDAVLRQLSREILAARASIYPDAIYAAGAELEPWGHLEMLAMALAAALGTGDERTQALETLSRALTGQDERAMWAVLRALRFVPVDTRNVIDPIITLLDRPQFDTVRFEAIMALSALPKESASARRAAQCLQNFIINTPIFAKWDTMRSRALVGLGNLGQTQSAPVLIEALKSDNPELVREAAEALGRVLGVDTATERIVETVTDQDGDHFENYAEALRWMGKLHKSREQIIDRLSGLVNTESGLEGRYAQKLLLEVGGRLHMQRDVIQEYTALLKDAQNRISDQFNESLRGARLGFAIGLIMDITVFVLGLALISISAALVLINEGKLDNWVYPAAGLGTAGVGILLYVHFIKDPRDQVRSSSDHQSQINSVFSAYIRQLNQIDQAFTRRLLDSDQLSADELTHYSERISQAMGHAITQLHAVARSTRHLPEALEDPSRRGLPGQPPQQPPYQAPQ